MRVFATDAILAKLSVLDITVVDIEESLFLLEATPIVETRIQHKTKPPTVWFVSSTFDDRLLFIAGIFDSENEAFIVKTARDADEKDLARWKSGKW